MNRPRLTLAVPTRNRAALLADMLAALVRESDPLSEAVEILVSDNASEDGTPGVIAAAGGSVRAVRQSRNVGFAGNFAEVLRHAGGDYLCVFGDDDVLRPGAVARLTSLAGRPGLEPVVVLNSLPGGDARPGRMPRGEIVIRDPVHLLQRFGIFQATFITNLLFHADTARRYWRDEFRRSRYPHALLALAVLRCRPGRFVPLRLVDARLPPDDGGQPLLTAIDMARAVTDHALSDAPVSLVHRAYAFLVRMVPVAVLNRRAGLGPDDPANPHASLRLTNVAACYRRSAVFQAAAVTLAVAAGWLPLNLLRGLRRFRRRDSLA